MFFQPVSKKTLRMAWTAALALAMALLLIGSASLLTSAAVANADAQKAPSKKAAALVPKTVTITPGAKSDDPPTVKPSSVTVGKGEEVEWVCSTGCDFTVQFSDPAKKPFKDRGFSKQKSHSGGPTGKDGTYKYTVTVGGGVLDPDVIIKGGGN